LLYEPPCYSHYSAPFSLIRRPPLFHLFPYTTLFRSAATADRRQTAIENCLYKTTTYPKEVCALINDYHGWNGFFTRVGDKTIPRSEEHTSELQSRVDLVCRLLLEKKKHIHNIKEYHR